MRTNRGSTPQTSTKGHRSALLTAACASAIGALAVIALAGQPNAQVCTYALADGDSALGASGQPNAVLAETSDATREAFAGYALAQPGENGTCLVCHTSLDMLQATATEDVDPAMYLVSEGYPQTTHGKLGCTYCHGGDASAPGKDDSMAGIVTEPAAGPNTVCAQCHDDIVERAQTSMHYTMRGLDCVNDRLAGACERLDRDLPSEFTTSCQACHGSVDCANCHVSDCEYDEGSAFYGFIDGHLFVDGTSASDEDGTCLNCHSGTTETNYCQVDVHGPAGLGMACMDCHQEREVHGDGIEYASMIDTGARSAECIDCHGVETLTGEWHSETHLNDVNCLACHTDQHRQCYNCHRAADGTDIDTVQACYLGYDTVTGKISTLDHAPIGTEMMLKWDVELQADELANASTFYSVDTHGTVLPEASQQFCDRCHGEGTYLLKADDLQYPEVESAHLVGELPVVDAAQYVDGN